MANVPPPMQPPYAAPPPPPRRSGMPVWAILLIVLAIGGVCIVPVIAAILFPVFAQARLAAIRTACLSNVRQQGLAMQLYANDNNDRFPKTSNWMDKIGPDIREPEKVLRCPRVSPGEHGYAMVDAMSDADSQALPHPESNVLIFESEDTSKNAHGDGKTGIANRHGGKSSFGYADGHVRSLRVESSDSEQ